MLEIRFLKFFAILILISSCAYFEDEEETILPGKRESVFSSEEEVLLKANKRISIDTPSQVKSWSQQHQNLKNHLFHFESNSKLKIEKKLSLGNIISEKTGYISPPIISNEVIFYSNNNYEVIAKNTNNGKIQWKVKLNLEKLEKFPLVAGFFLDDKKLFFVTGLGNLYCVDVRTGKILWFEKFGIQFSRPPIINKNKIFLISDDNQLYAIDKNTRKILWSHLGNIEELSIIGGSKPALDKGILIVTYSSGEIYALDEENGSVVWFDNISTGNFFSKTNLNDIQSPICIDNNTLYVPTFSNRFLVYDLKTGKKKWDTKISSINPITISGETIYLIDINSKLISLNKISGKLMWAVQLRSKKNDDEIVWSGPLLSSNKLLVVSSSGLILSLSPFTGKTLSKIKLNESFLMGPIQVMGKIYLISKKGTLYIFS